METDERANIFASGACCTRYSPEAEAFSGCTVASEISAILPHKAFVFAVHACRSRNSSVITRCLAKEPEQY
jgi:hypothetical protein